jgi:hypothetical protein
MQSRASYNPDIPLTPGTTKSDVVAFIYRHAEYLISPADIRDHLDVPHGTATTTLMRLHDNGLVGKTGDGHYHALDHREDLRHYVSSLDQLERMFAVREPDPLPEGTTPNPVDEEALEAEVESLTAEVEAEIDGSE